MFVIQARLLCVYVGGIAGRVRQEKTQQFVYIFIYFQRFSCYIVACYSYVMLRTCCLQGFGFGGFFRQRGYKVQVIRRYYRRFVFVVIFLSSDSIRFFFVWIRRVSVCVCFNFFFIVRTFVVGECQRLVCIYSIFFRFFFEVDVTMYVFVV